MKTNYYYLNPGYIFYSEEHYIIETVLGSCIAVCLWDRVRKIGGMNHFIFPEGNSIKEKNGKYGNYSVPYLIKMMLAQGSYREDLTAYIAGGANNRLIKMNIGEKNLEMAKEIIKKNGISIAGEWCGGYSGRKIIFDNYTGGIDVVLLKESLIGREK